jgi:hypothetical protein
LYMPGIYRLRRPKSSLSLISLGGVQTQVEAVRMDNCATGFP